MSNPSAWGPGEWHSIHTTAADATTQEKFNAFGPWTRNQVKHLPCNECTDHANLYIHSKPPEEAEDAFMWSWRFHNAVNRRLNKPEMDYTTARQIYLEGKGVCTGNCGK